MCTFLNKNKTFFFLIVFVVTLFSCESNKKETPQKVVLKEAFVEKIQAKNEEMETLLDAACLYCHQIKIDVNRQEVAPGMEVLISVYKSQYPVKQDFIDAFVAFTVNPSKEKSIMTSSIDQYGLMPNSGLVKEDVEEIADYLFDYKF